MCVIQSGCKTPSCTPDKEYGHKCYCSLDRGFQQSKVSADTQQSLTCLPHGQYSAWRESYSTCLTQIETVNWIYHDNTLGPSNTTECYSCVRGVRGRGGYAVVRVTTSAIHLPVKVAFSDNIPKESSRLAKTKCLHVGWTKNQRGHSNQVRTANYTAPLAVVSVWTKKRHYIESTFFMRQISSKRNWRMISTKTAPTAGYVGGEGARTNPPLTSAPAAFVEAPCLDPPALVAVGPTTAPAGGEARWHISIATIRLRVASRPCVSNRARAHRGGHTLAIKTQPGSRVQRDYPQRYFHKQGGSPDTTVQ